MNDKICPFMSTGDSVEKCAGDKCMLFVEGESSSGCGLVKLPGKTVSRLDIVSAQLQELQILINQIASKD